MRANLNLATEPFHRNRPVIVAGLAMSGLMVLSLFLLIALIVSDERTRRDGEAELARLNQQLATMSSQQRQLDVQSRQPGTAQVLDRSVFLNTLIFRKSISWTRIFADLEKTLPPDVRILSIRPQVNSRNRVDLDIQVAAPSPAPIIKLIQNLEASDVFGSTSVSTSIPPSQTDPNYRYRMSVSYAQKL